MKKEKPRHACGTNMTLDQVIAKSDKEWQKRKNAFIFIYNILKKNNIKNISELYEWEKKNHHQVPRIYLRYKNINEICSLEEVLKSEGEIYRRMASREKYNYQKRFINRDNKNGTYNSGHGWNYSSVRIPSMKRSNFVWKRFYELFPYYKDNFIELNNKNGIKLKKVW